jgi:hypothetical protein
MAVESSVVIEFKTSCEAEDGLLSVELDDELNGGRSCFLYGEKVYFRVYHSANLTITVESSNGSVFLESTGATDTEEENISFANTNEASAAKTILTLGSYSWFGRSLGTLLHVGGSAVRAGKSGVAIAAVIYTTQYDVYSITLSDQGIESYPVLVLVSGNV